MNTTTQRPTPETDDTARKGAYLTHGKYPETCGKQIVHIDFARKLERERDEAREQIASCAINTNVRLFDLVRYMRSELHQASLITDEEYSWLCNGCEMANSPQSGSPSPRRLEDYDVMSEQLEAMREALQWILNSASDGSIPDGRNLWAITQKAQSALAKLQPFIKP